MKRVDFNSPTVFLMRQSNKSAKVKLGNLDISAGTQVFLALTSAHHDTNLWGEDANNFNPSTFNESKISVSQNLAMVEAKVGPSIIVPSTPVRCSHPP